MGRRSLYLVSKLRKGSPLNIFIFCVHKFLIPKKTYRVLEDNRGWSPTVRKVSFPSRIAQMVRHGLSLYKLHLLFVQRIFIPSH